MNSLEQEFNELYSADENRGGEDKDVKPGKLRCFVEPSRDMELARLENSGVPQDEVTIDDRTMEALSAMLATKEDFATMHVIGQFDKSLILVCHENELLLIDQHASDEK